MTEPGWAMMEAFGSGVGSPSLQCICGRTHCCPDSDSLDEGEREQLRAAAAANPKAYVLYEGYDSVSARLIGGATVVPDCECQYMVKLEGLLWREREHILRFYKLKRDEDARALQDLDGELASSQSDIKDEHGKMETAWLIEVAFDGGCPDYYCGPGTWCNNPNHAHKFPTKEAAEERSATMTTIGKRQVTQHSWG